MEFIDTLQLVADHNLIYGNNPISTLKEGSLMDDWAKVSKPTMRDQDSFGLFDSSTPNYTTYYPGLTAEDLKPVDGDFVYPEIRLLSMAVVESFVPIDFSKPGVLAAATKMFIGKSVYPEHDASIGNALGAVQSTYWQEASPTIPAGINAILKIDGKSNPRIARGLTMDPPSIHSNSVTVRYGWEMSHANMSRDTFDQKTGTIVDGHLVRRVVTNIVEALETSLVSQGADPFAKVLKNGKVNDPRKPIYSFSRPTELLENNPGLGTLGRISYPTYNMEAQTQFSKQNNNQTSDTMTILEILKAAGITPAEGADDAAMAQLIIGHIASLKTAQTDNDGKLGTATAELETATLKVTELTEANTQLTADLAALTLTDDEKAMIPEAKLILTSLREEAVNSYKALNGIKADLAVVETLEHASLKSIQAFGKAYKVELEAKLPLVCTKCGSTELSRKTAEEADDKTPKPETRKENRTKNFFKRFDTQD